MSDNLATFLSTHSWVIAAAAVWTIPWKGVALWKAARNGRIGWFIALLILNTLAILEIIYIFYFSKKRFPPRDFATGEGKSIDGNRKII